MGKKNQSIKTYFKHYVNFKQNNWVWFLPITQLVYNNKKSNTTKLTPFFANYDRQPNYSIHQNQDQCIKTMVIISDITKLNKKITNAIIHSNNKIKIKINSKKWHLS